MPSVLVARLGQRRSMLVSGARGCRLTNLTTEGNQFEVYAEASRARAASRGELALPSPPPITAVEDVRTLQSSLSELLEAHGYEVFPYCPDGDAYQLVRKARPRAHGSGWQLPERLVPDPAAREIPVGLVSDASAPIDAHWPAGHALLLLLNPADPEQLLAPRPDAASPAQMEPPREGGRSVSDRLTPRQREIARLIALGYTNRQIAARLVLEPGSVANHAAHILDRLGLANRAQVAAWATRQGLLDGPGGLEPLPIA